MFPLGAPVLFLMTHFIFSANTHCPCSGSIRVIVCWNPVKTECFLCYSEPYWKWKVDGDTQMIWTAVNLWVFTAHQCSSQSPAALCWYHSFCTTQQAQCAPKCLHIRVIELWISIGSKFCPISKCASDYIICTKKKKKKKKVYMWQLITMIMIVLHIITAL